MPSGEIKQIAKSLKREAAEGALFEGMTEAAQGQVLDALANATYDDDRELISMEVLGQRFNEFTVGAVVGGGTTAAIRTGSNIVGGKPLGQPKETPPQDQGSVAGKKPFAVEYERTTKDGTTSNVSEVIYADSLEDAQAQANELLSKDNAVLNQTLTVTSAPTPMDAAPTPEPEVAPEPEVTPIEEPTPVSFPRILDQIEAERVQTEEAAPTPTPAPTRLPTAPPTEQPLIQEGMDQDETILYSQRT